MTPDRWQKVSRLCREVLERTVSERAAFLDDACAGNEVLRREVESLLAHEAETGDLIEGPAAGVVAKVAAEQGNRTHTGFGSGDSGVELIGRNIGAFKILSVLGAGGMGEVYRARDTKLGRDVAIKVLPEAFTSDPERLARFEREARLLAALNHPHIAAIYGFEEAQGVRALILELVEGPTLADRVAAGPTPVKEALTIARQIAEALEAAHEKGIIHRDLKPANIKLKGDINVKVLDFGLAKAFAGSDSGPDLSQVPTVTATELQPGAILGTPAYMSPEQARGQAVDKRTDIWAFGCVLYEILSGKRAFGGKDILETLAHIIDREPDFAALPNRTPAPIARLLQRCLEKDPKRRVPDMAVARFEIDEALTVPAAATGLPLVRPLRIWQRPLPRATAIVSLIIVAAGFAVWALTRPSPPRVVRFTMTPSGATALDITANSPVLAISPDGTRLAYAGDARQIVLRALDELQPTALQSPGESFFFSPDGQWIGFFGPTDNILRKVAVTGGPPTTVSRTVGSSFGASWSTDDTIILATNDFNSGLLRVAAAGGQPEVLTTPNREQGEVNHGWPEVLPGGQAVLFTIITGTAPSNRQIAVLDLATRGQKILVRGGSHARYVPTGHLVYGVAGTLWAVAFDLKRLEVVGTPVPVLEQVMTGELGGINMSLSGDGTLVYVPGGREGQRTLVWVDRQGREEPLKAPPRDYRIARLSPDGTRVALDVIVGGDRDIWVWDFAAETLTRLTFDPRPDSHPVWTPDGQRVVFRSARAGRDNLFWQAADGTGAVERLTESPNVHFPTAFSPDGTQLVFREETATPTGADVMVLALDGGRPAAQPPSQRVGGPGRSSTSSVQPLVQTPFQELNGEISPDGRWVAYQSDESGQQEIYVRPFPDTDRGRWQISTGGGEQPLWARSGKELFYLGQRASGRVTVMSASVESGPTFRAGNPRRVFEGRDIVTASSSNRVYDVSPDGQRFLMIKEGVGSNETGTPPSIVVVQNWTEELKRLVPTK